MKKLFLAIMSASTLLLGSSCDFIEKHSFRHCIVHECGDVFGMYAKSLWILQVNKDPQTVRNVCAKMVDEFIKGGIENPEDVDKEVLEYVIKHKDIMIDECVSAFYNPHLKKISSEVDLLKELLDRKEYCENNSWYK